MAGSMCVCYQFKIWTDFGWMNCFALKFVEAVMKLDKAICWSLHMALTDTKLRPKV